MEQVNSRDVLQRIWDANGLGKVEMIQPAKRGMNNRATVVNDAHVIRFDLLDLDGVCRYKGEQLAYERLKMAGTPAPEVVALDLTKSLIPYHYMILTKSDGTPLIDDWPSFSEQQKAQAGRMAGHYLAMMHEITFDGFGNLKRLSIDPLPRWFDHVERFVEKYAPGLVEQKVIDASIHNRMRVCVERLRPMWDIAANAGGRLVHSDYQFENLLHCDGVITAIIDFEWSISGDPTWDFRVDEQWDGDCPGSAAYIYEGYTRQRQLTPDHAQRVWLYKMLFHLDSVDMYAGDPKEKDALERCYGEMMKALANLEASK